MRGKVSLPVTLPVPLSRLRGRGAWKATGGGGIVGLEGLEPPTKGL